MKIKGLEIEKKMNDFLLEEMVKCLNVGKPHARLYHQSFNNFIEHGIKSILMPKNGFIVESKITKNKGSVMVDMTKFHITDYRLAAIPGLDIQEATHNFKTYAKKLMVDLTQYTYQFKLDSVFDIKPTQIKINNVNIGRIPIMSGTKYCDKNIDGRSADYTINGRVKHIVSSHTSIENKILCVNDEVVLHSRSKTNPMLLSATYIKELDGQMVVRCPAIFKRNTVDPTIHKHIPFILLLKGLGMKTDREIFTNIVGSHHNNVEFCKAVENIIDKYYQNKKDSENTFFEQTIYYVRRGANFNKNLRNLQSSNYSKTKTPNSMTESDLYLKTLIDQNTDMSVVKNCMTAYPDYKAMKFIRNKNRLRYDFIPHIDEPHYTYKKSLFVKALYLCEMMRKDIEVKLEINAPTDRDNFKFKRFMMQNELLTGTFNRGFMLLLRDIREKFKGEMTKCRKRIENKTSSLVISDHICPTRITHTFTSAFNNQKFYVSNNRSVEAVVMEIPATNLVERNSIQRRIKPIIYDEKNRVSHKARLLHESVAGFVCPAETSDGANTGINNHLALTTEFTTYYDPQHIKDWLVNNRKKYCIFPNICQQYVRIIINGVNHGSVVDYIKLFNDLKYLKNTGKFHRHVAIILNYRNQELHINTSAGRMTRPLMKVKNNRPLLSNGILQNAFLKSDTYADFLCHCGDGIEYVDVEEQLNALIALDRDMLNNNMCMFTHMEIHKSLLIGASVIHTTIPHCKPGPRVMFQSSQIKSSLGIPEPSYRKNMTAKHMNVLQNVQRPLYNSMTAEHMGHLTGQNIVVAICCYTGFNMEDSIIINKRLTDTKMLQSTLYNSIRVDTKNVFNKKEKICIPAIKKYKQSKYMNLDENGIIKIGSTVSENDIIVGKVTPTDNDEFKDTSVFAKRGHNGYVDRILHIDTSSHTNERCVVRIAKVHSSTVGDKLSSRHGQKGVIGAVLNSRDMPRCDNGIIPDLIINAHSFPSRMTLSYQVEMLKSIVAIKYAKTLDAAIFSALNLYDTQKELEDMGMNKFGTYPMTNGMTGERMHVRIAVGGVYYQVQKHMVHKKRAEAPKHRTQMDSYTRQPRNGRAKGGGLRFGEMERDGTIGHGTAHFLNERLMKASDETIVYICRDSGEISAPKKIRDKIMGYQCDTCKSSKITCTKSHYETKLMYDKDGVSYYKCPCCERCENIKKQGYCTDISKVSMPYPFKLMGQLVQMCNLKPKYKISSLI